MIYLDANFFIFALLDQTQNGVKARNLQREFIDGKKRALTSVLTLDEVMWVLIRNKKEHLIRKAIEDIYAMPNTEVREVPALVPLRAMDVIGQYRLKPRDAFHVAVMETFNVNIIISDDHDFDRVKHIKRIPLG